MSYKGDNNKDIMGDLYRSHIIDIFYHFFSRKLSWNIIRDHMKLKNVAKNHFNV